MTDYDSMPSCCDTIYQHDTGQKTTAYPACMKSVALQFQKQRKFTRTINKPLLTTAVQICQQSSSLSSYHRQYSHNTNII